MEFVKTVVSDLQGEQGIRGCINKIVEELVNNNTAIVDFPVELPESELDAIRAVFEQDSSLRKSLNKLLFETRFKRFTQEQIARCLELLVQVHGQGGVGEDDQLFAQNTFYFQVLKAAELIQKERRPKKRLAWNIHANMKRAIQRVQQAQPKRSLADYLLKLYAFKGYSIESSVRVREDNVSANLNEAFAHLDFHNKTVQANVEEGMKLLAGLRGRSREAPATLDHLNAANLAFSKFSNALSLIDGSSCFLPSVPKSDTYLIWRHRPGAPESLQEAMQRVEDYRRDQATLQA